MPEPRQEVVAAHRRRDRRSQGAVACLETACGAFSMVLRPAPNHGSAALGALPPPTALITPLARRQDPRRAGTSMVCGQVAEPSRKPPRGLEAMRPPLASADSRRRWPGHLLPRLGQFPAHQGTREVLVVLAAGRSSRQTRRSPAPRLRSGPCRQSQPRHAADPLGRRPPGACQHFRSSRVSHVGLNYAGLRPCTGGCPPNCSIRQIVQDGLFMRQFVAYVLGVDERRPSSRSLLAPARIGEDCSPRCSTRCEIQPSGRAFEIEHPCFGQARLIHLSLSSPAASRLAGGRGRPPPARSSRCRVGAAQRSVPVSAC